MLSCLPSCRHVRRKATWGSRLFVFSTLFLVTFAGAPTLLAAPPAAKAAVKATKAPAPAKQQKHLAKAAEQKLDATLRERYQHGGTDESEVIVHFNNDVDAEAILREYGRVGRRLPRIKAYVLRVANWRLAQLADDARIKGLNHDRPVKGFVGRTAATIGSRAVVDLMGYNGAGVGVAIVDSGMSRLHDDLRPTGYAANLAPVSGQRVGHFKDFVNGQTATYDDWGHGTHVGGIVAGNGYDSKGVREAIAPGAHLIVLKALDRNGSGTISNIIAAIDYAISIRKIYNIRVINLSLGARVMESYHTDPLTLAAKRAVEAGIVVVASAGNMGRAADGTPQYGAIGAPGNAPWVLTVGASSTMGDADRRNDTMANYSSRGPTMIDFAAKPDLVAPGSGTVSMADPLSRMYYEKASLLVDGTVSGLLKKPYLTLSGTSMSAPVVAGTVALMLHANPSLTPNMVKAILQFTAQVYPQYDFLTQGAGFLNARGAVVLAEYFSNGKEGMAYPKMKGWSQHIFWGNRRVRGGVLAPNGTAWADNVVWGDDRTPTGQNIIWGENCTRADCSDISWGSNIVWGDMLGLDANIVWGDMGLDANIVWGDTFGLDANIVWGDTDGDHIVWGNSDLANIVWGDGSIDSIAWGNFADQNIVWGNDCAGANCEAIVWGAAGVDNIIWGNAEGILNIVWGNFDGNIVWGNSADDVEFGDDTAEVGAFDSTTWDDLFELAVPESPPVLPPTGLDFMTPPTGGLS
jgi:serine protease AprX